MLKIINETLIELIVNNKMTDKNKERLNLIIEYLKQNDFLDNKDAQKLLNVSKATAKRFLNKLVKENILEAVGEYKARKYIKNKKEME